jgi:hypothetical protein
MNAELGLGLSIAALALQAAAITVCITLWPKVERWVWMLVFLGFVIMAAHRVDAVLHYNTRPFNQFTAILIALIAFVAVIQTKRWIRKREKQTIALFRAHEKLEALADEVRNRQPIATRIAEILSDLRNQIDFYEDQCKKHQLPTFTNGHPSRKNNKTA